MKGVLTVDSELSVLGSKDTCEVNIFCSVSYCCPNCNKTHWCLLCKVVTDGAWIPRRFQVYNQQICPLRKRESLWWTDNYTETTILRLWTHFNETHDATEQNEQTPEEFFQIYRNTRRKCSYSGDLVFNAHSTALLLKGRVWCITRVNAFSPKGHRFDSRSSLHIGPLDKSLNSQ